MNFNLESWVVLWSPSQNKFQKETVSEMLSNNMDIYARKAGADYIVMAILETQEEARRVIGEFIKHRDSNP